MRKIRAEVGVVFQYPEHQLFEETVEADIAFGPKKNLGLSEEEVKNRVIEAAKSVGLSEKLYKKSPFELSGGQKRRASHCRSFGNAPEGACARRAHGRT